METPYKEVFHSKAVQPKKWGYTAFLYAYKFHEQSEAVNTVSLLASVCDMKAPKCCHNIYDREKTVNCNLTL